MTIPFYHSRAKLAGMALRSNDKIISKTTEIM